MAKALTTAILHNHPIHYKHLLFQEMVKLGLDFTVVFGGNQSEIRAERTFIAGDLYKHRFLFDGSVETAPALTRIFGALRALREIRPQLVISCGYERPENWAAWLWGLLHRTPVILWYESNQFDWPRKWWKELPKRLFMKGLCGAHVYGNTNRQYLIKLGLKPDSILVKRAVVDVARFDLARESKQYRVNGKTNILYVGRLAPEKNILFLIKAFAEACKIAGNQIHLTLVGAGPEDQAIRRRIADLDISEFITLTGYVPQASLPQHLEASDVFVLPSIREPWGLVALEAMLSRMPVLLSTRCGCAADLISLETGWMFSPFNGSSLASLLSELPDIPSERLQEMGDAAHALAVQYSPQNSAAAIVQSIRDLPANSNRIFAPGLNEPRPN